MGGWAVLDLSLSILHHSIHLMRPSKEEEEVCRINSSLFLLTRAWSGLMQMGHHGSLGTSLPRRGGWGRRVPWDCVK